MSTRACIKIKEKVRLNINDKKLTDCVITLYHHHDGYPSGVGTDLKELLKDRKDYCDGGWDAESIATDLVRGIIKDSEGNPDFGYKCALCEHDDCEYDYEIDCDKQTLTCYELDYGQKPWKHLVEIPDRETETNG